MEHNAAEHLKEIARKSIEAEDKLAALFVQIANITLEQAYDLVAFYQRKKLVKLDLCNARLNVKHGAYLDRGYIELAATLDAF
jgi:hypothetical protein